MILSFYHALCMFYKWSQVVFYNVWAFGNIIPTLFHSLSPCILEESYSKILKDFTLETTASNTSQMLGTRTRTRSWILETRKLRVSSFEAVRSSFESVLKNNCCSLPFRCLFLNIAIKFFECFETQNSARLR